MTVANVLTLLRIFLVPFFVLAMLHHQLVWALAAFVAAIATDGLDGFIARRTTVTRLGCFLDPAADKLLLVSAFVLLPLISNFPAWVSAVVVARDGVITTGYLALCRFWGVKNIHVRLLGKLSTFMQSLCVGMSILGMMQHGLAMINAVLAITVAAVAMASGVDYSIQALWQIRKQTGR